MTKPWHERPLFEKVYLDDSRTYLEAGKIVGHTGCSGTAFFDAAKLLPCYDKLRFESAVRDLCVHAKRERGEYELTALAKKVLRPVLGPPPDSPEYAAWWRQRLTSVAAMREQGTEPTHAVSPPVPLSDETPPARQKKGSKKAKKAG